MWPQTTPSANSRTSTFPMRNRANSHVSTGVSLRFTTRTCFAAAPISSGSLHPARAGRRGVKGSRKVLRFVDDLAIQELHDADRRGRATIVGQYELCNPEVARADDAPHLEPFRVWLSDSGGLDVSSALYPLA